jgi:glycosyltransferase involved in cell wall biosynthesis
MTYQKQPVIFVVFQTGSRANGGVESVTQIIERCQQVKPIVITQLETSMNQRWRQAGAEVQIWSTQDQCSKFQSLLSTNLKMYRLVRETNCAAIHCNDIVAFWQTAIGAKLAGAPVVFNIRSTKAPNEPYALKWQAAFALSDRQVVLSREMREQLIARLKLSSNRQTKLKYIYSAVDSMKLCPASQPHRIRDRFGIKSGTFALGFIAQVRPVKAQLEFIEQAVPLLKQAIPNLQVYFLGDFDPTTNFYAARCSEAVKRLALEDTVTFVGYTSRVADWYRALDLVVLTSRREGLARCMIEGLACGTPVVSFDVCSADEILLGYECGQVAAQGDYDAIVNAIAKLARDPALRETMSRNGVKVARELFQPDAIVQQYENLYQTLAIESGRDQNSVEISRAMV